jgi:hypothetical protein
MKFVLFRADFWSSFVRSIHMGAPTEETEERPDNALPVNDNTDPGRDADIAPWETIDRVVLSLARLIGRRIARKHFEALQAANDNASSDKVDRSDED